MNNGTITAFYGDENYKDDGSNGQVMVYQPKFFYKTEILKMDRQSGGIGYNIRKANYYISSFPRDGFKLHPAFRDETGNAVEYILFSAYEGGLYQKTLGRTFDDGSDNDRSLDFTNDMICSIAGVKPISGVKKALNKDNFEKLCNARGKGWHCETIKAVSANQMLMMIELGTLNTQSSIGQGVVGMANLSSSYYNCSAITGSTAVLGNKSGEASTTVIEINGTKTNYASSGYRSVSYRGMENVWGNIWKHVQGINCWGNGQMEGGQIYVADDFNFNEKSTSGNYCPAKFSCPNKSGYIKAFGYGSDKYDWLLISSDVNSSYSAFNCDYRWSEANNKTYMIFMYGGRWYHRDQAGAFFWDSTVAPATYIHWLGGRMMYIPTKATN